MKNTKLINNIVEAILSDVTDRRGWRQEWDNFDEAIKCDIVADWKKLVKKELEKNEEA